MTGLSEGFIYRGAAPVAATNYNYGQVVLEPNTDVYYYFTSTISASVARADIATHANFQAISGETGHSPRVGSGNAFPTTPAPFANDIFFFDADVASGLDWKDTDGTTDLTAASTGDMARFDGTDWIKVVNVVGNDRAPPPAGGGYSAWEDIGSRSGAISSIAVTVTLDTGEDIDDYEEMYIHIEANDTNDQRSVSARFRTSEVPVGADLLVGFPGNNTDEGSILVRRNTDGTELTLDPHGSVISFRLRPLRRSMREC